MKKIDNLDQLKGLQIQYLAEAEELFGAKIDCEFEGIVPGNVPSPKFCFAPVPYDRKRKAFMIIVNLAASEIDRILQLSHEVVHMLSPVKDEDANAVNYLEEGMATYFSKIITDRDTPDPDFAMRAIKQKENYFSAYELYVSLHQIDEQAVKKLRKINPNLPALTPEDFAKAGLKIEDKMIAALLAKF